MRDGDGGFPDDVPVADAVEQQQTTADSVPDEDPGRGVPLEATASDWQEQRDTVLIARWLKIWAWKTQYTSARC
jgi:hypothetical protein